MRAVFSLDAGQITTAINGPETYVYVIRAVKFEPSREALWDQFVSGNVYREQPATPAAQLDAERTKDAWLAEIRRHAGLRLGADRGSILGRRLLALCAAGVGLARGLLICTAWFAKRREHGRLAQLVRASRLHREGQEFESLIAHWRENPGKPRVFPGFLVSWGCELGSSHLAHLSGSDSDFLDLPRVGAKPGANFGANFSALESSVPVAASAAEVKLESDSAAAPARRPSPRPRRATAGRCKCSSSS